MLTNDTAALVERNCEECGGSGVAETIAGFDRPCDVCHGSGAIKWTQTEAVLLDQIEAQAATITELREALRQIYVDATEQHADWCNMGPVDDEARDWAFDLSRIALEALKVEATK